MDILPVSSIRCTSQTKIVWRLCRMCKHWFMEQGLTRDAVAARFEFEGRRLAVVDTAGRMRRSRLDQYDDSGWVAET